MSDGFNPYREWLGLDVSSPNYYELLGLPLQESDAAKIAAAADRAITRVRSFRPGPQAREWARLLDEIRAAKECLLDANCRARYEAEQASAATADPILPPESSPEAEALPEAIVLATASPASQTWSAGPSPIYGFAGNENASPESLPAAITIPTSSQTMTPPIAIPEQPVLHVASGTAQRATFRAATTPPLKIARPRGRGAMWGVILLLWLVVAGLTYRLSVVARQRQAAEDAATEVEAKRDVTEPRANSSPPKQAESRSQ
ncbi:MAG TPA: hypothetical protein VGI40_16890 [Pirellulaceae bacterium]